MILYNYPSRSATLLYGTFTPEKNTLGVLKSKLLKV